MDDDDKSSCKGWPSEELTPVAQATPPCDEVKTDKSTGIARLGRAWIEASSASHRTCRMHAVRRTPYIDELGLERMPVCPG